MDEAKWIGRCGPLPPKARTCRASIPGARPDVPAAARGALGRKDPYRRGRETLPCQQERQHGHDCAYLPQSSTSLWSIVA